MTISTDRFYSSVDNLRNFRSPSQEWLNKAKDFKSPAPQPEDPRSPLLLEMLVVAPYKAPEKREKKKTGRAGLRTRDQLEAESEETHASSNQEEEEEHEVEGGGAIPPSQERGRRHRTPRRTNSLRPRRKHVGHR